MRYDAVFACGAGAFSEAASFPSDDASDAFIQLHTHPSERWVMCELLLGSSGAL